MPAIAMDEPGNIYVLAPPPEEGKPRPLVRLNKRLTTMGNVDEDILNFAPNDYHGKSVHGSIGEFKTGEFTLFFIPEEKAQNQALQEVKDLIGSSVEFKEILEPAGLILFLDAFVADKPKRKNRR